MAVALQGPEVLFGRAMGPIVDMQSVWGFRR